MNTQRIFTRALPVLRCQSTTLRNPLLRIGLKSKCVQNQVPCLKVWHPTPLRAYFTNSRPSYKDFVRKLTTKPIENISNFLRGRSNNWLFVRTFDLMKDSKPPKKMENLLFVVGNAVRFTPKWTWSISTIVCLASTYLYHFYKGSMTENPLSGRKRFMIQTDEEALQRSEFFTDMILKSVIVVTKRDPMGEATDPQTKRLEKIMLQLRNANPELDAHKHPGATWRPIVVQKNAMIGYKGAIAFGCGRIMVAHDILTELSDDHLGFIIGHEMSHVAMSHENEYIGSNIFFFHFFKTVMKTIKDYDPKFDFRKYIDVFQQKIIVPDRTEIESEADEFGWQFAVKACFDYRKFSEGLRKCGEIVEEQTRGMPRQPKRVIRGAYGEQVEWDDDVLIRLMTSELWMYPDHESLPRRCNILDSETYMDKAATLRKDAGCPPLPALPPVQTQPKSMPPPKSG